MAEDWDLQAVVRSCSTAVNNTTTNKNNHPVGDPLFNSASLGVEKREDPFCFPDLFETRSNPFEELEQFYKPFFTTTNITPHITHTSSISDFGGFKDQQQHIQQQQEREQHQQQHQIQFQKPRASSALTIGPRPRRRKNQQKRVVCEVTAESLSSDLWAWRKYGQKPIKGSPYPRNYYRCSSSKGCGARKQVERSPTVQDMFIVTYTGDHTHPRPTHRNSLAGSTRNKFSTIHKSNSSDPELPIAKPSCSSPSPISSSSLSPTTPLSASMDDELAHHNKNKDAEEEEEENDVVMGEVDVDDEDLLIPNMVMSEDIFMGFQELGGGVPGTVSNPSPGSFQAKLVSPWAPSSSATPTTIGGGGGC